MKKRLLSALLALALVFVLLPTTALADSFDPDITIAGTKYDFQLEDYKTNTYAKVYYQHGKFLTKFEYTQDGVWATDPYLELTKTGAGNDTTITVTVHKGSNTTKAFEIESAETCIATSSSYWNLVITGSGALNLVHTGTSAAIWSNHCNITITGGVTVNVKGTKSGSNINSYSKAIQCGETFTVSNGATVVAENNSTYSNGPAVKTEKLIVSGDAKFEAQSAYGGKAISFDSITADGYDFMGRSGNSGSYTTLTGEDKATKLQEYRSIKITPTPTPTLEESDVYVAGTKLYKNTAYTIQNGKPVMGGTYPDNYNIYFDTTTTNWTLHVKNAVIDATGTTGIYGTSNIVFEGTNSITASSYGIYSYFTSSDLKISGSGSLMIKTIAACPAIATDYNTSRSIIISGNNFTVTADTSKTTSYAIKSDNDLTIKDGAIVIAKSNATRAIDIKGDLTVTNGSLTATSKSDSVPTVQVGGNASFTGSTVTITNNSATQGKSGKNSYEVSTGLYVGGTLDIKNAAKVTSTVTGGNAIYAKGDITISGDGTKVEAQNSAYKFSAISTNGTVNISDNSTVKAENGKKHQGDLTGETDPSTGKTYNACPAITGKIANKNTQNKLHIEGFTTSNPGTSNPTDGVVLNLDINPSSVEPYIHHYYVTITRGDAYTTPQVAANYTIAGQTMYVGKYYKTDARGNITEGTAQDYNIFCDSENDFTLNNATISSTGTGGSTGVIMTNLNASSNEIHIKLIGTNSINNAGHHAILGEGTYSTIIIENAENASNASLTISGNFLPVYSFGNVTINAEVVIINTNGNGYLISTNKGGHANGAFDLGSGYKCYASTSTTGTPLEEFNSANYSTYKYLRVTTQTLETGGGSTHQHTWDTTKWYSVGDDYHARKCTGCDEYDLTNKQAHYAWPDEDKGPEGHTEKCMLCDYKYDQSVIKPHEWTGWWVSDYQPEVHAQRCNCGYQGSTHRTLKYVAINSEQHQKQCPVDGCGYKIEYKTSHVYEEGSNICTECGYDKSAPCNHTGDRVYTNNGDGTHKVTCKACGATIVEKETHEFDPTGACVCGATQSGGNPTPDNPGTIVIIRPAEEEKPAQQPNPSTGANDLVGLAVAAAVAAALGSAALLRKHD